MQLNLIRTVLTEKSTIGELSLEGRFLCYTLEDTVRPIKIPKRTAIPYGHFPMILSESRRFGYVTPELLHVPNFGLIRIHRGNCPEDTEGCILVGLTKGNNIIGESKRAFDALMELLTAATGPLSISIERAPTPQFQPRTDGFVA